MRHSSYDFLRYNELTLHVENIKFTLLMNVLPSGQKTVLSNSNVTIHSHFYYELFYARDSFSVIIENQEIHIEKGQILIVAPNTYHSAKYMDSTAGVGLLFTFKNNKPKENSPLYRSLLKTFASEAYVIFENNEGLSAIMQKMLEYQTNTSSEQNHLMTAKFYELIFTLKELKECPAREGDNVSLLNDEPEFEIDNFIGNFIKSPDISLEKISKEINLSTTQINRIIKKKTGLTFRQYVITLRMLNATHLLVESQLKIKDIADIAGYNSVHGFYSAFRKKFNCTPEEYRRKYRS